MPTKFVWDNLPGIDLFDILGVSKKHLVYSCFNYNSNTMDNTLNVTHDQLRLYYTGERFLYDLNADVIVGFHPDMEQIRSLPCDKLLVTQAHILSYPVEVINVLQGYTNMALKCMSVDEIIKSGKQLIIIRDQERGMLEYLFKKGLWDPNDIRKKEINIYMDLEISWSRVKMGLKTRFCCFIVSNPACWQRNNFFEMLSKYKPVDSLGKYKPRIPDDIKKVPARAEQDEYFALLSQYKFMITFENNSLAWYNTEKIFNAFQAGTIPIYWGDPLIQCVYNPECFVWVKTMSTLVDQYNEFARAINYIKQLDINDELYLSLFNNKLMVNSVSEDERLNNSINTLLTL